MDYTVFKTDKTFTRIQRPKLFFSRPYLCLTAPEVGGSFNTHQPNQVTKNMLVLGTSGLCWALLHWPVWRLLVTIQVSGQNGWAGRVPGHGRVGGLWTPGLLVEAGITEPVLRRKMDRADWTWVSISGMDILQPMGVENKRCAESGLNLASWQRPF